MELFSSSQDNLAFCGDSTGIEDPFSLNTRSLIQPTALLPSEDSYQRHNLGLIGNRTKETNVKRSHQLQLVGNSRSPAVVDSVTGMSTKNLSFAPGEDVWNKFGEPKGRSDQFWDVRYQLYFKGDKDGGYVNGIYAPKVINTLNNQTAAFAKEGAILRFEVRMTGRLYNNAPDGMVTDKYKELYNSAYQAYQIGIQTPMVIELDKKLKTFTRENLVAPTLGAAWISTNTIKHLKNGEANNNWAANNKDFDVMAEFISIDASKQLDNTRGTSFGAIAPFFIKIKEDLVMGEQDEYFEVELRQNQSAVPAVNNYVQKFGIYIVDDTTPPQIPILIKYSKAQEELLSILNRYAEINGYINNLEEFVSGMSQDTSSIIVKDLSKKLLEQFFLTSRIAANSSSIEDTRIAFEKFAMNPQGVAIKLINDAITRYIVTPQAKVAIGKLTKIKNMMMKAEIDALRLGATGREIKDLNEGGSPAANIIIKNILSKL